MNLKFSFAAALICFIFFPMLISAQSAFQKMIPGNDDDGAFSILQTLDGGYIVAGNTQSYGTPDGLDDMLLVKTDANGTVEWLKAYGDSLPINATCIRQKPDSTYMITGRTFNTPTTNGDVFLMCADKDGSMIFYKTYGDSATEGGQTLELTSDGGYIICGGTLSLGAGDLDMLLLKTDSAGNVEWMKTYGSLMFDHGTSVKQLPDGGYLLGGRGNEPGNMNILLTRTKPDGDTIWSKTYSGIFYEESYNITLCLDGNYMIAGTTNTFGAGKPDVALIKTDTSGNILNSRVYGDVETEASYSIHANRDSGFTVVGYSESSFIDSVRGMDSANVFLIRVDKNLDTLWSAIYGGPGMDESYSVVETDDNGFAIAAFEKSYGSDSAMVFIIKTDSIGQSECLYRHVSPVITIPSFTVTNNNFAIDTTAFIAVDGTPVINSFLVNEIDLCLFIGINDKPPARSTVRIYPNPFDISARIELEPLGPGTNAVFELFDTYGRKAGQLSMDGPYAEFYKNELSPGVYVYRVLRSGGIIGSGKLVIF